MFKPSTDKYLFHYTTLPNLALIMSNKTLRLFPLSNMDDLQEAKSKETRDYGRFIYVSSWTSEEKESIPMWKMYSRPEMGIRIGLVENPFMVYDLATNKYREVNQTDEMIEGGVKVFCNVVSPFIEGYGMRNPLFETQLVDVIYTDDNDVLYPDVVRKSNSVVLDGTKMGIAKNTYWRFQQEVRYRIITYIKELETKIRYGQYDEIQQVINQYAKNLPQFIDLHLSERALRKIKIRVAPDFSDSNRVLLQALLDKYAPDAIVENSVLKDIIR